MGSYDLVIFIIREGILTNQVAWYDMSCQVGRAYNKRNSDNLSLWQGGDQGKTYKEKNKCVIRVAIVFYNSYFSFLNPTHYIYTPPWYKVAR